MITNYKDAFNYYQSMASGTAIYPDEWKGIYPILGLVNEAGEVAGKLKKVLRDDNGHISDVALESIKAEVGDVLWYVAAICTDLGFSFGDVVEANLVKLASRQERGVLGGSGDNR